MRTKKNHVRNIDADPRYGSVLVSKLINRTMLAGHRSVAARSVYDALKLIKEQTKQDELKYLEEAIETVKPQMEVRSRRVGGASYQVPMPVRTERKTSLALRWLVNAARDRSNSQYHSFAAKLAAEVIDAHGEAGNAIKKKLDTHRMADANKAFSHFRW